MHTLRTSLLLIVLALLHLSLVQAQVDPPPENDVPPWISDAGNKTVRSADGFFVFIRHGAGSGGALVDSTGRLYWSSVTPMPGEALVTPGGRTVLAGFGRVEDANRPTRPRFVLRVVVRDKDGTLARQPWSSPAMPITEHWPPPDVPIEDVVHLITGLSPDNLLLVYYLDPYRRDRTVRGIVLDQSLDWNVHVDFVPRAFEFADGQILVRGDRFREGGPATLRLDVNGRRVEE